MFENTNISFTFAPINNNLKKTTMKVKTIIGDLVIPEAEATRFECRTKKSNGSYTDIVVENAGVKYYHVSPTGETAEIGDLYAYLRYLRQCNAMWLTRKSNGAKPKTKRIFLTRDEAKRLLRYGYSMVFLSLDKAVTITPMEGYAGCSCSDGKTIKIDDIPGGDDCYCINWRIEPLKETFDQYKARMEKEAREAAISDREAKEEREREEAIVRILKEAEEREEKLKEEVKKLKDVYKGRRPMPDEAPATSTQHKKKSSYKDFFKGVAVGAGVVLAAFCGVKVYKKKAA